LSRTAILFAGRGVDQSKSEAMTER